MTLKYRIGLLAGIFTILVLLFYNVQKQNKTQHCDFNIPKLKTMSDIVNILKLDKCGVIENVFNLYSIEVEGVPIKIPKTFEEKVSGWLGGDKELIQQSRLQKVIQITNRLVKIILQGLRVAQAAVTERWP